MAGTREGRFRRNFILALTLFCALAFLAMIAGFLDELLLAAVFTGLVYPLYRWLYSKLRRRRSLAAILTISISLLVVLIPLVLLLGIVADQAAEVAQRSTPWLERQMQELSSGQWQLPAWLPFETEIEPLTETIVSKLAEFAQQIGVFLAEGLAKLSQGTVKFFFEFFVMIYAIYFFLIGGPAIIRRFTSYLPLSQSEQEEIILVGRSIGRATIKGTIIIGLIQGVLGGLGFAVAGIPSPAFWGAVMTILSILPAVGAPLVWIPAVIYLLFTGHTVAGIGLLIWSAAVVGSVDNFLRPILVGRDTKLPDLLILMSTLGGIGVFGAAGLILGPMLAALLMTVLEIYRRVFADSLNVSRLP